MIHESVSNDPSAIALIKTVPLPSPLKANTLEKQPNNPLHGITLATIVEKLEEYYSWEVLADKIPIRCFKNNPSIKSSLKFLRKNDWARTKVEDLYLRTFESS